MAIFETFNDLVPNYKFEVDIPGFGSVNFQQVDGLGHAAETQEYQEGGTLVKKQLYTGTRYRDITLRRGVSTSNQLWDYSQHPMRTMDELAENSGSSVQEYRTDITIKQLDNAGNTVKQWVVIEAWVKEYNLNTLNADSNQVSIENVVLAHSGFIEERFGLFDEFKPENTSVRDTNNGRRKPLVGGSER